jgi:hypothetical protein
VSSLPAAKMPRRSSRRGIATSRSAGGEASNAALSLVGCHLADYPASSEGSLLYRERALRAREPPDFRCQRVELALRAELDFRRPLWPPLLLAAVDELCLIRLIKSSGNSAARVFA